jgi:hypothetical protein
MEATDGEGGARGRATVRAKPCWQRVHSGGGREREDVVGVEVQGDEGKGVLRGGRGCSRRHPQ